jgi:GTPase SAR1 family protein
LAKPNAVILLVGNQIDIVEDREITEEQANDFAQRHNMKYTESSVKVGEDVREVFVRLTTKILERVKSDEIQEVQPIPTTPPVFTTTAVTKDPGCSC